MDAAWLAQLAATGAAALVGAAATDAWGTARDGFGRLLRRRSADADPLTERRLDALAEEVEQTSPVDRDEVRQRLIPVWQTRLADLIEEDPAIADDVAGVSGQVQARLPVSARQWVQHITAHQGGIALGAQGDGSSVHVHYHSDEAPPRPA
ncbi:hypothetical protein [Actinoplanes sp. CA-252034]|uniref:hypothetical protein n=1 Tax=Actinoplanes sp. CA-252034 TaxID=3239906 RepID=UPI003D98A0DF